MESSNYKPDVYLSLDDIIIKRGLALEGQNDLTKEVKQPVRDEGEDGMESNADELEEFIDDDIPVKNVKIIAAPVFIPVPGPVIDKKDVHLSLDDLIVKRGIPKVPKTYAKKGPFTGRNSRVDQIATSRPSIPVSKTIGGNQSTDKVVINRTLNVACKPLRQLGLKPAEPTGGSFSDQQFSKDYKKYFGQKRSFGDSGTGADVFFPAGEAIRSKKVKVMEDAFEELPEEEDDIVKDIIFGPSMVESAGSFTIGSTSALKLTRTISNCSAFNAPTVRTSSMTSSEGSAKKPIAKAFVKNPFL